MLLSNIKVRSLKFALSQGKRLNQLNFLLSGLKMGSLFIMTFSGMDREKTTIEIDEAKAICLKNGGKDLGESPARRWYKHRYSISYHQSVIFSSSGFNDTMEVATNWDNLIELYYKVRDTLSKYLFVMAHFSHAYSDGCSIYFTFAAKEDTPEKEEELYLTAWEEALKATAHLKAAISHHHGVGISKMEAMKRYWSKDSLELMSDIIYLWNNIGNFNKGKLLP